MANYTAACSAISLPVYVATSRNLKAKCWNKVLCIPAYTMMLQITILTMRVQQHAIPRTKGVHVGLIVP